jgi:hypothetical protein
LGRALLKKSHLQAQPMSSVLFDILRWSRTSRCEDARIATGLARSSTWIAGKHARVREVSA